MKQRKLASLLAVTLSLELMVSPLIPIAHAEEANPKKTADGPAADKANTGTKAANIVNSTAEAVGVTIGALGSIYNEVRPLITGNQMSPQMAGDMQKLQEQQTPTADKYFNSQKLMLIIWP
jgi:hypothetical protein